VGFARARREADPRSAALMAATGAGIFAAQMVNFPVGAGTSGHLIGAALAAILLGPWRGMLTMAVVLVVQCLVFGDGGSRALGANLLNMAVVATLVAWAGYSFVLRRVPGAKGALAGTAVAALGSVLAAAVLCAAELAMSGAYAPGEVLWAMLGVHFGIGVSEALLSVAVVAAGLALGAEQRVASTRKRAWIGLAIAVAVAGLLAPWASAAPDGLERVADDLRFASLATDSWAVAPDYAAPGVGWPALAVALAGISGAVFVFASTYSVGRTALARVRKH
jgi:cobalt/nickel transport system permease protein